MKPPVSSETVTSIPAGKFYFFSADCTHCAAVQRHVEETGLKQRLYYIEQRIDNNPAATDLLKAMGRRCGLADSQMAVPFFWDGTSCYLGEDEVISYFNTIK